MNFGNLSAFQKIPDYFSSKEACLHADRNRVNTNPKYPHFKQIHFTAGDIEQFNQYCDAIYTPNTDIEPDLSNNVYNSIQVEQIGWEKYHQLEPNTVHNTFLYQFEKFKKGIFIKISSDLLFLPFSNIQFVNEWSRNIRIHPKYKDIYGFIQHIQKMDNRPFLPKHINRFQDTWYSNNCLVRYEFPVGEGDSNHTTMKDMFRTLQQERNIPNVEFFVNRRDFPILKKDGTEAYEHMFNGTIDLLSHNYSKYTPILSMVEHPDFADIPIPTGDDWARVSRKEGKYFSKTCNRVFEITPVPWEQRKPIAVFRGSSTGCGVTINTNPRLGVAFLSKTAPPDRDDSLPLLDAGITSWNLRPRKIQDEKYLQTIDIDNIPIDLAQPLSSQQQAEYKYVINIPGHVAAFRLSFELSCGFCILLVESDYKLWFQKLLQPYVHYIPVKGDLSDLLERVKWCKNHDSECKKIAENAKKFADTYLSKDGILDYLQKVLWDLKKVTGRYLYNSLSLQDVQMIQEISEMKVVNKLTPQFLIPSVCNQIRSNDCLKMVEQNIETLGEKILDTIVFEKSLNDYTQQCTLRDYPIVIKMGYGSELIHEYFVTKNVTNNLSIPNFAYTFSIFDKNNCKYLVKEYIKGITFSEYITGSSFTLQDYILILMQITLSLHVARQNGFVSHYNLNPDNIIIHTTPEPIQIVYDMGDGTCTNVKSQIIPVIINMENAHVIFEKTHYSGTEMFKTSSCTDILTLLITSLYKILSRTDNKSNVNRILRLANFLTDSRFRESGKDGLGELRFFLRKMERKNDFELLRERMEGVDSIDLFEHIFSSIGYKLPIWTEKGDSKEETQFVIEPFNFAEETFLYPNRVLEMIEEISKDFEQRRDSPVVITFCKFCYSLYRNNLLVMVNEDEQIIQTYREIVERIEQLWKK